MEHRWSERIPASFDVLLFKNNTPVATCKVNDISMYGVFIKSGPVKYPVNSVIDVGFTNNTENRKKVIRLSAYVARTSDEGIGLAFYDENIETFENIRKLIKEASNENSSVDLQENNK